MPSQDPVAQLLRTVSDAVDARTCVVLVGMPGSGRRSMLARVKRHFAEEDWTVRTVIGFGPHGRALESLALSGLLPAAPGAAASLGAAVQAITALAASGPALLLIEQGDLLDEASASAIAAAVAVSDTTVVTSIRPPYPGPTAVDTVLARRESTALWMPVLPFPQIHRLVADALNGDVDSDLAGRVYALSGGLPGVARAIVLEARRAGRIVQRETHWHAERDLWTPALAVVMGRYAEGLSDAEREGCWVLAELGPTEVSTVRRLIPWSTIAGLDDRGLVRFVETDERTLVALFPPVLEDHLRHRAHSAHGRAAAELVADARAGGAMGSIPDPAERPLLDAPLRWSTSPEAAAILGRLLGEDAATRVTACRAEWEREPDAVTAVAYLQALLDDGAPADEILRVLRDARARSTDPSVRDVVRLRIWEAMYRGVVQHDAPSGLAVLAEARAVIPEGEAVLDAMAQHLRLVVGGAGPAELPPYPGPEEMAAVHRLAAPIPRRGLPRWHATDVVRLVRGEVLLSSGSTTLATADFADLSPADPLRRDPDAVLALAQLCDGDIDGGIQRSLRQLDLARGTLDRYRIEPHGYVVALGLYLRGRLQTLRDHLTGLFAVNAPTALRPDAHAGLLSISASLSLWEKNVPSARAMIAQIDSLQLRGGPFPLMSADAPAAALAISQGAEPAEATRPAWERVETLIDDGHLLAAVFDGARLVDLHADQARGARLAQIAHAGQGTVLPALGDLLDGAVAHSAPQLLRAADTLRALGMLLHATRAHTMGVQQLREDGRTGEATAEASRLRGLVTDAGDELLLLTTDSEPASELTARETQVARLIAAGLSNREVAQRLVVSDRTVDNHVYRIFRKLGITSREELAQLL